MSPPDPHPSHGLLVAFGRGELAGASSDRVRDHLVDCPDCRRVAKGAAQKRAKAPAVRAGSPVGSADSDTADPTPFEHPDYEIVRELGRGGMGVVYLGRNRIMDRLEALKVVGKHLLDRPGVRDRFLREIRSVARLRHENVVAAYSVINVGDDLVCAMEYVDGTDLARLVKQKGPLAVAAAANFLHQAALGLQHAHENGIVHRDVKPGNLMLCRPGRKLVVKLLDFGLTKAASEAGLDGSLTMQGQMLGTPDYVAPEQTLDAQAVDIRADIYSLGCTAYYLLTGGPPFKGKSLYDLLQSHHSMDAPPLNEARADVPAGLAALVAKMMAKDPADRFQTPADVARALVPFSRAEATPASAGESASPPSKTQADPPDRRRSIAPLPPSPTSGPADGLPGLNLREPRPVGPQPRTVSRPWPVVAAVSTCLALVLVFVVLRRPDPNPIPPAAPVPLASVAPPSAIAKGGPREALAEPAPAQEKRPEVVPFRSELPAAVVGPGAATGPDEHPVFAAAERELAVVVPPAPAPVAASPPGSLAGETGEAVPVVALTNIRRVRARPGVPELLESGEDVPVLAFWPPLTPANVEQWRIGDPEGIKLVKRGLVLDAGPGGTFLLTAVDTHRACTLSIGLFATEGTEAYLALRARDDPEDGWEGVTSRIAEEKGEVHVGGFSRDFQPETATTDRKQFPTGNSFTLEFRITERDDLRLLVNGKAAFSAKQVPARPRGAVGLFLKKGRVVISRLNVR